MSMSSPMRALLVRWYISVPGFLLSLVLASVAFSHFPLQYTSSGTAVLVQPKRPELYSANPLLTFDPSLNTTTLILVQALSAPMVSAQLGLTPGEDTYTVKNGGSSAVSDGQEQPFISVTAQSTSPEKTRGIVLGVMDQARQELTDRQINLRVATRNYIRLDSVVDATPPKPVRSKPLAALGVALLLGLFVTTLIAWTWDRLVGLKTSSRTPRSRASEPEESHGQPTAAWTPAVVSTGSTNGAVPTYTHPPKPIRPNP
jgi:hypothetical protein